MLTVAQYILGSAPTTKLSLPVGAQVLTAQKTQDGLAGLFVLVDVAAMAQSYEERSFRCIPAGLTFQPEGTLHYIASIDFYGNGFRTHIFEER